MGNTNHTYLVPTLAGAEYVVASSVVDDRREILWQLLRGGAGYPQFIKQLVDRPSFLGRKELGQLLFLMQREGMISGETEPLLIKIDSFAESIQEILGQLSITGESVLADNSGVCVAYAGIEREEADHLSAVSAEMHTARERVSSGYGMTEAVNDIRYGWKDCHVTTKALNIGKYRFVVSVKGGIQIKGIPLVRLVGHLAHRCLGKTVCYE